MLNPFRLFILFIFILPAGLFSKTTVIAHGYTFPGIDPLKNWMIEMGEAVCERQGGGILYQYIGDSGDLKFLKQIGTNERNSVVLFEWVADSNDPEKGHSEAAGNALFCALIEGEEEKILDLSRLHFIGHSRGCVVNAEAAERLLVLGYSVDQMTFLDAHDWGLNVTHTDYYVNPEAWKSGIEVWKGVKWSDAYWHDATVGLSGRPVSGAYSLQLDVKRHWQVYQWYLDSIKNIDSKFGYYWTIDGGGVADRPAVVGEKRVLHHRLNEDGILNGEFEYVPPLSNQIPSWSHHGGAGRGHVDGGVLELDFGNHSRTHDRVYVDQSVNDLVFDFKISNADGKPVDEIDRFVVSIDENPIYEKTLDQVSDSFSTIALPFALYRGEVVLITFKIVDVNGVGTDIDSEVKIDHIRFE